MSDKLDALGQIIQVGDYVALAFRGGTSELTKGKITAFKPIKITIEFQKGIRLYSVDKMPSQIIKIL